MGGLVALFACYAAVLVVLGLPRLSERSSLIVLWRLGPGLAIVAVEFLVSRLLKAIGAASASLEGLRVGASVHPIRWQRPSRQPKAASLFVASTLGLSWLAWMLPVRLFRAAWAFLASRERTRNRISMLRGLRRSRSPSWLKEGRAEFRRLLARRGIRDTCGVQMVETGDQTLGWYLRYSQFEQLIPVFYVSDNFGSYVVEQVWQTKGEDHQVTEQELASSVAFLLAHEYGHVITELAFVAREMGAASRAVTSDLLANRLCDIIGSWRSGPRGIEEAFADDVAVYLRPRDPAFARDECALHAEVAAPNVARALRLHGALMASLDGIAWADMRDFVRLRGLQGPLLFSEVSHSEAGGLQAARNRDQHSLVD